MPSTPQQADPRTRRNLTVWPGRRIFNNSRKTQAHAAVRLYVLGAFATLWLLLIAVRLWDLQVLQGDWFTQKAQQQQEGVVEVRATRGAIYDRFGEELALSTPVDSIGVFPSKVRNSDFTVAMLAEVLRTDPERLRKKLRGDRFQWVKRLAEPGEAERVRNLELAGVHFEKESKRYYPQGTIASHILGAVGIDHEGQAGLEQSFEELLRGRSGQHLVQYDALRNHYASRTIQEPIPGADLVLTIDRRIQVVAENELAWAIQESRAKAGTVVVLDPKNGDILALANWPTFDPNERVRTKADLQRRHNYAVSNLIEPGSTFKIVTISGAIEEGLATADELINCEHGSIYVGGRRIRDHKPFDLLTVSQVLAKSSNVGAIKLAMRLQPTRMFNYIERFGFGRRTGIELPGEIAGLLRPLEAWQSTSLPSISFGQEIGVTALQLARAAAAIANGGFLVKPRIVDAIVQPDGRKEHQDSPPRQQILSPTTSAVMRAMMETVVREGTGRLAQIPGYRIAGKTGTAQKIDPATGGYSPTDHIANFVGFVPVNDPSVLMVIALDSPVDEHHGGQVAAPIFSRIASQALRFRDVPPELSPGPRPPLPRDSKQLLTDYAERDESAAAPWDEDVIPQGQGHNVVVAALEAGSVSRKTGLLRDAIPAAERREVALEVTDRVVPDLEGRTVREVIEEATALGLRVDLHGRGVVRRQFPRAGTPIARGSVVRVDFRSFQKMAVAP